MSTLFPIGGQSPAAGPDRPPLIYTSCFRHAKKLPSHIEPVGIAIWSPSFKGRRDLRLAPTRAMLKMSDDDYDRLFFEILEKLDPEEVYNSLTLNGTQAVALLCYEHPGEFCHRRYVAEWLEAHLDIVVPEYGVDRAFTETMLDWKDA